MSLSFTPTGALFGITGSNNNNNTNGGTNMTEKRVKTITFKENYLDQKAGTTLSVVGFANKAYICLIEGTERRILVPAGKVVENSEECSSSGTAKSGSMKGVEVQLNNFDWEVLEFLTKNGVTGCGGEKLKDAVDDYCLDTGVDEEAAKNVFNTIATQITEGAHFVKSSEVVAETVSGDKVVEEPTAGKGKGGKAKQSDVIKLTDISGGRLPKSGIDHQVKRFPDGFFGEEHNVHIPQVNKYYKWDVEALEAIMVAFLLNEKALITGPPGTGKTTAVEQFAAWVNQPYMRLGGRGDLESSSFLGYPWAAESGMEFKFGLLPQALQAGYLTTIDEVFKIPPQIAMAMQHLYEKNGYLTIDDMPGSRTDKVVRPTKEFRLFLTDNVKGTGDSIEKFAATQIQDSSMLDRVSINIPLGYMAETDEVEMLKLMFPKTKKVVLRKLVKFANLIRSGYNSGEIALTVSPRGLVAVLEMMTTTKLPLQTALNLAFINKIADDNERAAIGEMYKVVGLREE